MTSDHGPRTALRERFARAPHLPDSVLREVLDRVPETTQLSVVPTHQTRGRFRYMSGATKFAFAGVLGVAAGGLLVAGVFPSEPSQDPRPAAEASASPAADGDTPDPMAAAWVTGEIAWAASCEDATTESVDEVLQERGHRCESRMVTSDDPRLAGDSVITWNKDVHWTEDSVRIGIRSLVEDIRGDGGGWRCVGIGVLDKGPGYIFDPLQGSDLRTCTGDGDNAGLTALLAVEALRMEDKDIFTGLIFPGDVPPAPEAMAEE